MPTILLLDYALMDEDAVGEVDRFGIVVQTANLSFGSPQRGDKFLMLVFWERGHSRDALRRLNRVRLHLQIIFLSNILSASGLSEEEQY